MVTRAPTSPSLNALLTRPLSGLVLALAFGLATGIAAVRFSVPVAFGLVVMPAVVVLVLRSLWISYAAIIAVLCLAPFAVLPFGAAVTPALLELTQLVAIGLLGAVTLIDRREYFRTGGPQALVLALIGVTAFAFLLGYGRGYSTQTMHDYFKFVLAIATFFVTVQLVRSVVDAEKVIQFLLVGSGAAAAVAIALYAGGPTFTERVLVRLVPYGYPGSRVVRFIEDDPQRPMRAVGTSVDPNSFGGLLMIGFVLAVAQLLVKRRCVPAWVAAGVLGFTGLAMLLTYSRGAWVGAAAGVGLVIVMRRPWLSIPLGGLGAIAVAAGLGSGFVQRLWLGFTLQDPATRLRLAEYRNAWEIIQRHPWFGVGFGDAPTIDLQAGVSSIYLTIAERAGLIGLGVFLVTVGVIFWRGLRVSWDRSRSQRSDASLSVTAALLSALTVGLVDHYFFNPQFPHMAALLWIVCGVIVSLTLIRDGDTSGQSTVSCSIHDRGATREWIDHRPAESSIA